MKCIVSIVLVGFAVAGCAEVVNGPRVVYYTPDRFYIRNVPAVETWPPVTAPELARLICARSDRKPVIEAVEQFNPIDIRDSTFHCATDEEIAFPSKPAVANAMSVPAGTLTGNRMEVSSPAATDVVGPPPTLAPASETVPSAAAAGVMGPPPTTAPAGEPLGASSEWPRQGD